MPKVKEIIKKVRKLELKTNRKVEGLIAETTALCSRKRHRILRGTEYVPGTILGASTGTLPRD